MNPTEFSNTCTLALLSESRVAKEATVIHVGDL